MAFSHAAMMKVLPRQGSICEMKGMNDVHRPIPSQLTARGGRGIKTQFLPPIILLILLLLAIDGYLFAANTKSMVVEIKKIAPEKNRMILSSEKDFDMKTGQMLNITSQCEMKVEQAARKEILVNYKKCPGAHEFQTGSKIIMNIENK